MILFYREGESVRAVAESLEISESAAKQRLARGRNMLRDQLDGLVESVVARTSPSSAFTVSVAAALGALAAPAAIAGGAFSATTKATSSNLFSEALTAMNVSKPLIATSVLVAVAFVPVGYQIPMQSEGAVASALPADNKPAAAPAIPDEKAKPPAFKSELFLEWERLHDEHGRTAVAMPALYEAIRAVKDPLQRRAFHVALVSEWLELDPVGGFGFYFSRNNNYHQEQFFFEWLARDSDAAIDTMLASETNWKTFAQYRLKQIIEIAPSRIAELAIALPKSRSTFRRIVADSFAMLAEKDLDGIRELAESVTGPNRAQALSGVAEVWARRDWDATLKWARTFPEGPERDEVIRFGLVSLAGIDPIGALEQIDLIPPNPIDAAMAASTGGRVLRQAAKVDFEAALNWVVSNPGQLTRDNLLALNSEVTKGLNANASEFLSQHSDSRKLRALMPAIDSALLNAAEKQRRNVWDWAKTQPESPELDSLRKEVLAGAGFEEPELAFQLAADLPDTEKGREFAEYLGRRMWNGGRQLLRFETWYEQAPESFRPVLVMSAFGMLHEDTMPDPQVWIDRLNLLPESDRKQATAYLARGWADGRPEQAGEWAQTLPAGDARNESFGEVATQWARQDVRAAAEWIDSLPSGADRDSGTVSLVKVLSERYPIAAWDWALTVQSSSERSKVAAEVARSVAMTDAATARRWISDGPFSASERAGLFAELNRHDGNPQ